MNDCARIAVELPEVYLTPRERQVVALVVDDLSHGEIAQLMQISIRTVEHYVAEIARRLPRDGRNRGSTRAIRRYFRGKV